MKRIVLVSVLAVFAAACGGGVTTTSTTDIPATTVAATTTATATTSSSAAPTSTTLPPVVAADPLAIPRLGNGLPATFVAVTEDWEAVEVDTATGSIIRSIGQSENPVEAEDEGMVSSAIQQVWRTSDHSWYIVSECCEPAAGTMYYLEPDALLTAENRRDTLFGFAWTAAPSPFDGTVASAGYYIEVGAVGGDASVSVPLDQPNAPGFADGVVAWDLTGSRVSWISNNWVPEGGATLVHLDLEEPGAAPDQIEITWIGPGQWIDGLGRQQSGNYVAFLHTEDSDPESTTIIATEGVVFAADGELIATFTVETGSAWGGYEPSGRMLIYTDGENNVRWQGVGQSGILAAGFIHASW